MSLANVVISADLLSVVDSRRLDRLVLGDLLEIDLRQGVYGRLVAFYGLGRRCLGRKFFKMRGALVCATLKTSVFRLFQCSLPSLKRRA
jgi:hypothetical protein